MSFLESLSLYFTPWMSFDVDTKQTGGGTGSGLGTYVLSLLSDYYPEVYRFTASVFPSEDDDVVGSSDQSLQALITS
eukprot:720902-Hanusia_phi.AAC.1